MCGEEMIKKIDALTEKIDNVPNLIQDEFKKGLTLCGIDPENPIAMQELVLWGRETMTQEKQLKTRVKNTLSDIVVKGLVFFVLLGFITFYTQSLVKYAIREEKIASVEIEEIRGSK